VPAFSRDLGAIFSVQALKCFSAECAVQMLAGFSAAFSPDGSSSVETEELAPNRVIVKTYVYN